MNCDRLAPWYRWLEYLGHGRKLERCRDTFLPQVVNVRRVLMLGEGDGRFLASFLKVNFQATVDYVDSSARMVELAERRAQKTLGPAETLGRVRFHHADALHWPPPPGVQYDLVVTHFFLDCFTTEQLAPLLDRLSAVAAPRARWIVSEFHQPARGFAAWRARRWIAGLYGFFRVVTGLRTRRLPDYRALLEAHGFRRQNAVASDLDLLISELWQRG